MKTVSALLMSCFLAVSALAGEITPADQKWLQAVEKMITAGPTTIATPQEQRVEMVKKLVEKLGRKYEISRTENGYRIKVS